MSFKVFLLLCLCIHAFVMSDIIDPSSLRVRRLQTLLKSRGMSQFEITEKSELVALVHSSGVLSEDELMKSSDWEDSELSEDKYFPRRAKTLHKNVKSKMCSVLLLYVVPEKTSDAQWEASGKWKMVRRLFKHLGIETGHSKCLSDTDVCGEKQRLKNQMVLVVPQRDSYGRCNLEDQSVRPYHSIDSVLEWVQDELATTVSTIESESELENIWMKFHNTSAGLRTEVRVVLIPPANGRIPLFYSSLGISLENKVSFGVVKQVHAGPLYKHLPPHMATQKHLGRYVIITPHGVYEYGSRPNEHPNFKMMKSALENLLAKLPGYYLRVIDFVVIAIVVIDFCYVPDLWVHLFKMIGVHLIYLFIVWLVISVLRYAPVVGGLGSFLCELLWTPIEVNLDNSYNMVWVIAFFTLLLLVTVVWLQDIRQMISVLFGRRRARTRLIIEEPPTQAVRRELMARLEQLEEIPTGVELETLLLSTLEQLAQHARGPALKSIRYHIAILRRLKDERCDYVLHLPQWTHPRQDEGSSNTTDLTCVICQEDYQDNDEINGLPCGHNYHVDCIRRWILDQKQECPICKTPTYNTENY